MKIENLSNVDSAEIKPAPFLPQIKLLTMFRLGLFQMGLGLLAVLTLGVLNRVMITELGIPPTITAATLTVSQFVAPLRILVGQLSDSKTLLKTHRTGYVWLGASLFFIALFFAVQVIWKLGNAVKEAGGWVWNTETLGLTSLLAGIFAIYGIASCLSSTPFFALLVDVTEEEQRGKLIGIVWSMMTVGIAAGGIISKILLKNLESVNAPLETVQSAISNLFLIVPAFVFVLAVVATFGIEKKYSRYSTRSIVANREDKITLKMALKILTASKQTALFFTFMLIMTVSLFMQEAVLEPYGGKVFQMSIPETSMLNSFWGIGMLMSLSATGFFLIPRIGKRKTTQLGCLATGTSFLIIILAGFTANQNLLKMAMVLFGLAAGIATTGALSLMLDLTAAETAGTFVGAWGLAQAIARGSATIFGGIVVDIGNYLFTEPVLAYGSVFAIQALGMFLAVWFLNKVNIQEFKTKAQAAIQAVMEGQLD